MKKLLHLQLLPLLSGVQNFSLHLLEGLDSAEFEIWVACKTGGPLVDEVKARGYRYIPLRFMRHEISIWDLPAWLELLYHLRKHRFDIVHTNSSKTGLLGRFAAWLNKVPLIIHTVHGTAWQEGQSKLKQLMFKALEYLANKWCHHAVFVNNSDRLNCLKLHLLPESKAITIYNALPYRQVQQLDAIADKRVFDAAKPDFVVGSTLRFSLQKNAINLVGAACRACSRDSRLRFVLLGDGELLELCRRIVQSHGLSERILLPGWDFAINPWLQKFDAFILYSRWEAQPFSIIEAMHSALPIVVSDIPSLKELVDEESGYRVPLDDTQALVHCLLNLAENPEAAFQKGIKARDRVLDICSYEQMLGSYLNLYRSQNPI